MNKSTEQIKKEMLKKENQTEAIEQTTKPEQKLTIAKNYDMGEAKQMVEMAKILKNHIVHQKLFTKIKDKNYAHVEGWQFAGGLMGVYPRIKEIHDISNEKEKKWRADVEITKIKDDKIVGFGSALCSNLEANKKSFDEYAILSMAQTRAIGKAYRNFVGWVMKLAGYESTPAEEMPTEEKKQKEKSELFEKTITFITQIPEDKRNQAIKQAIASGQFTNKQIKKLNKLKCEKDILATAKSTPTTKKD